MQLILAPVDSTATNSRFLLTVTSFWLAGQTMDDFSTGFTGLAMS